MVLMILPDFSVWSLGDTVNQENFVAEDFH